MASFQQHCMHTHTFKLLLIRSVCFYSIPLFHVLPLRSLVFYYFLIYFSFSFFVNSLFSPLFYFPLFTIYFLICLFVYLYIYITTSLSFLVFHVSFLSSRLSLYVIYNYISTCGLLLQICPSFIQPWYAACVSHTFYHPCSNL